MNAALGAPFLAAAGVLCVSGAAKLRAPRAAVPALALLGLPARAWFVALIAAGELGLGLGAVLAPGRLLAFLIAVAYAGFGFVAARLVSLQASCGCFGESEASASPVQAVLSISLAAVAIGATVWPPGGAGWVLGHPPGEAVTLLIGVTGCVYGLVVAYTQLGRAWGAWSAR